MLALISINIKLLGHFQNVLVCKHLTSEVFFNLIYQGRGDEIWGRVEGMDLMDVCTNYQTNKVNHKERNNSTKADFLNLVSSTH